MRALWLRLLLLAVFFNTAVGVPLHAAEHWHGAVHAAGHAEDHGLLHGQVDGHGHDHDQGDDHDHPDDGSRPAAAAEAPGDPHAAHGACTWCSSHAQLAAALLGPATVRLPEAARATPRPALPEVRAHAAALRWRYAARAPPPAA